MNLYIGKLKKLYLFLLFITTSFSISAQSASTDANLINIVKRVYKIEKFDGIKIFETEDIRYLVVSVKIEKKNNSDSYLSTLASIKAKAILSSFQNGSYINTETIIISTKDSLAVKHLTTEMLKEYSSGFVKGLSTLTILEDDDPSFKTYFYYAVSK